MRKLILSTDIWKYYNWEDKETITEDFAYEDGEEYTDEELEERIDSHLQDTFCEFINLIKKKFDEGKYIIKANLGLWNGNQDAYNLKNSLSSAIYKCLEGLDLFSIEEEDGNLIISGSHHDGSNEFSIKQLNAKGLDFLDEQEFNPDISDYELYKKLYQDDYSEKLYLYEKTEGWF